MGNKKVPGAKISCVIALHLIGSSLVLGSGNEARQDTWITMIIGIGLAVLLCWLYSAVLRLHPGKNMFDIFIEVCGNVLGKILCGIYVVYAIFVGSQVFRIFDEFIQLVNLPQTPQIAILLMSVPLIVFQVKTGLKNMGSTAKFMIPILYFFVLSTFFLGIRYMNIENLQPALDSTPRELFLGIVGTLTLPFGELVICMSFFGEIDQKEHPFKILLNGVLLGGLILLVAALRNLLILGPSTSRLFLFASYDAVGVISIGDFITRISVLIGINLVLAAILKISTFLYAASVGISKILNIKTYLQPAASCGVLMATLGFTLYDNVLTGIDFIKYLPVLSIPVQIIIPLIILIVGKIKKKSVRKKKAAKAKQPKQVCPNPSAAKSSSPEA